MQKRAPEVSTICVYTRGFRGHLTYISPLPPASLCLPSLLFSLSRASISLRSRFFLCFLLSVFDSPHIAFSRRDYRFIIPQLFRIHATPFRSLRRHNPLLLNQPSFQRELSLSPASPAAPITHARPSIKYTFVGGPAMWRPVIYFSSNCNFSNTYCPLDKCARLFLTRLKNTMSAPTAFLEISPR